MNNRRYLLTVFLFAIMSLTARAEGPLPHDEHLDSLPHGIPSALWEHQPQVVHDSVETWDSPREYGNLAIHGKLILSSKLKVANLLVCDCGELELRPGADIEFRNQPIDITKDPEQWGNGLVAAGRVACFPDEITPYIRSTSGLAISDKSATVDRDVTGWVTGDRVLILGTRQQTNNDKKPTFRSDTETVTLTSASPFKFSPLIKPHAAGVLADATPHMAVLKRSIVIRSENPAGVRGHVVCVGDSQTNWDGVWFASLGRTRADVPLNVTTFDAERIPTRIGTNQIGRYALHYHHCRNQPSVKNSLFTDSRAWAVAIHDSHNGTVDNNVIYLTQGAGIVTEDGTERDNRIEHNLITDSYGGILGYHGGGVSEGPPAQVGTAGEGIWCRGTANFVNDNIIANCRQSAIAYNGYFDRVPTAHSWGSCDRNEVYASGIGVWCALEQGVTANGWTRHAVKDLTAWNIRDRGVIVYHSQLFGLENARIAFDPSVSALNLASSYSGRVNRGLDFTDYDSNKMELSNVEISGANIGVHFNSINGSTFKDVRLSNYVNIVANAVKAGTTQEVRFDGVTFVPSGLPRRGALPATETDVWMLELIGGNQSTGLPIGDLRLFINGHRYFHRGDVCQQRSDRVIGFVCQE